MPTTTELYIWDPPSSPPELSRSSIRGAAQSPVELLNLREVALVAAEVVVGQLHESHAKDEDHLAGGRGGGEV